MATGGGCEALNRASDLPYLASPYAVRSNRATVQCDPRLAPLQKRQGLVQEQRRALYRQEMAGIHLSIGRPRDSLGQQLDRRGLPDRILGGTQDQDVTLDPFEYPFQVDVR